MIEFLNSLTKSEMNKLYKFVCSPYFNQYRILEKLFRYFRSKHPFLVKKDLNRKVIHKYLYGKTNFNDANIRKLLSLLTQLIDKYLIQTELEKDEFGNRSLLLKSLRSAKFTSRYNHKLRKTGSVKKVSFYKDQDYYLDQIMICEEHISSAVTSLAEVTKYKILKSQNVNYFFIYLNLVCYFQILFEKMNNNESAVMFDQSMFREVMNYTEMHRKVLSRDHPNIIILYFFIRMLLTYDDKYYRESLEYYKKNSKKFDLDLKRVYFLILQHYLRIKLKARKGDHNENNILIFELNDLIFRKNIYYKTYYEDGRALDCNSFLDILVNAVYMEKIRWIISFYEDFSKYINKEHSNDCYSIFSAFISYHKRDFAESIYHLNQLSSALPYVFLEGKILYCFVAFEMGYFDSLNVHLKYLSAYIKNNKSLNSINVRESALFIRYFRKLLIIRKSKDLNIKTELNKLGKEIEREEKFIPYRKWFLQIINDNITA